MFLTATAKSLQFCPTLCDPIDGSPPGSPVPGILQARTLEGVAISFSNAWKWKVKVKSLSCKAIPTWFSEPFPGWGTDTLQAVWCDQKKRTRETYQEITWGQIKGVQALHTPKSNQQPCPWTIAMKLLTKSSLVRTHSFWGISPPLSPLWQSKATRFFFNQISVSEIRFTTSA